MRLDRLQHADNNLRIKGVVEIRGTQEVPRVDHQVDETESHVGSDGNVAVRARDLLPGRCREERLCLAQCGLTHVGDWIISDLGTSEHGLGLVAVNACEQQCGEAVPHHHVLNQLAYRDSRRRRLFR
ncbi:hypothetical protein ASD66_12995 [Nocardioides sp. Root151]|nr:hypothetical protein ASD30_24595 [Nocardioides sp. Root140]KQZ70517.1 hypothetical protein ASD66_12995 [Nocardioides sp. Root151]